MSIANSPDCLSCPKDKALQMPFPSVENGNAFDEFLNAELYASDQQDEGNHLPENCISVEPYTAEYPRLPSLGETTNLDRSPTQPWRKGLWCLNQAQSSKLAVDRTRKAESGGTISISHLISNGNFAIRTSRSPVVGASVTRTKRIATSPSAAKYHHKASVPPRMTREATLSPRPMYAQLPIQSKMEQVQSWQEDFQNFHLRMSQQSEATPPDSPSRLRHGDAARQVNAHMVAHNAGVGVALPEYYESSALGHVMQNHHIISARQGVVPSHQAFHDNGPTPIWTTESLYSSDSSQQPYETMPNSLHWGHRPQSSLDPFQTQLRSYWAGMTVPTAPVWDSHAPDCYRRVAAPAPQRITAISTIENLDHSNGLGIQYPEFEQMDDTVLEDEPHYYIRAASNPATSHSPSRKHHTDIPPVPPLPFLGTHAFSNSSSFITPRKQRRSPSGSPSPPLSPTESTARSLRLRSPSRTERASSHHRRKSIHKSGPIRDNAGENMQVTPGSARSRSTSRAPRTPKTPKTPSGALGAIDFVNFTPRDSAKLLSDVAPSGSSKTRARREAEARERRKRFNEAAMKAVSSGDVEALKKAIDT